MRPRSQVRFLPDGKRLHLQDGPIDIVLQAFAEDDQIFNAYRAAADRFESILDELCSELALLRKPVHSDSREPKGKIAKRMFDAVHPYAGDHFITPMAAVAGAVAEEILSSMTATSNL